MWNKEFEGWYFKHQKGDDTLAFIPGTAKSGAFIQMLGSDGTRQFSVPELSVSNGIIRAGCCIFSRRGISINLPGVKGKIEYGRFTELTGDIMGPFKYLPMECRHGIISMGHTLAGSVCVDGAEHTFSGGKGYIEKDSGASFPRSYLWVQCNDFDVPCSLMVSIARIPFAGIGFTGCICAVIFKGREYRLATYSGVRILAADPEHIRLIQGSLLLEIDITRPKLVHKLRSPVRGQMSGSIREGCNAAVHARLWNNGKALFDLTSRHAVCEAVFDKAGLFPNIKY